MVITVCYNSNNWYVVNVAIAETSVSYICICSTEYEYLAWKTCNVYKNASNICENYTPGYERGLFSLVITID